MLKKILITGFTSGIGKATAIQLRKEGHDLILLGRESEKFIKTKGELASIDATSTLLFYPVDLSSLQEVKNTAEQIKKEVSHIDCIINNAGGIFKKKRMSVDGYEMTFAVNHLAHFLLTNELLPLVLKSDDPRIVNLSSVVHKYGKLDFNDLDLKQYTPFKAYANSKLCNIYFTHELHKRYHQQGLCVNAVHPGTVGTNFGEEYEGSLMGFLWKIYKPFVRTPLKGAQTSLYLATSPAVKGASDGYYYSQKIASTSIISQDKHIALQLWNESETMIQKALKIPSHE